MALDFDPGYWQPPFDHSAASIQATIFIPLPISAPNGGPFSIVVAWMEPHE